MKLYADGQYRMETTVRDGEPLISASPWKLGAALFPNEAPFQGSFGRVRISTTARYKTTFAPRKQFLKDAWTLYLK